MTRYIDTGKTTQGRSIPLLVARTEIAHREIASTGTSEVANITAGAKFVTLVALGADIRVKFGTTPTASATSCSYIVPNGQILQLQLDGTFTEFAHQAIAGTGTLVVTEL